MITVLANGRPVDLPDGSTLTSLLDALGVSAKAVAAMEHNGEPVPRAARASRSLADGDRIELVRAVAPGRFDVCRDPNPHIAFGHGIHACLGAPLARLEGASVFRTLAERVGSIEVLPGAERTDSAAIRGFATLPVRVTTR